MPSWERKRLRDWTAEEVSSWFVHYGLAHLEPSWRGLNGSEMSEVPREEFVWVCQSDVNASEEDLSDHYTMLLAFDEEDGARPPPKSLEKSIGWLDAPAEVFDIDWGQPDDAGWSDGSALYDPDGQEQDESYLLAVRLQKEEEEKHSKAQQDLTLAKEIARSFRNGDDRFSHTTEDGEIIQLFQFPPANEPSDEIYEGEEGYHDVKEGHPQEEVISPFLNILDYPERLFLICDGVLPASLRPNPQREELFNYMAKVGILRCGFALVGGFIRDYLFRGVRPVDIDFRVPGDSNELFASAEEYVHVLSQQGINGVHIFIELSNKHEGVVEGRFLFDGEECKIDFVAAASFGGGCRVDFDVNNFQITEAHNIHQRVNIGRPSASIIQNILHRKCVPISSWNDNRVKKMQQKGWTVIF